MKRIAALAVAAALLLSGCGMMHDGTTTTTGSQPSRSGTTTTTGKSSAGAPDFDRTKSVASSELSHIFSYTADSIGEMMGADADSDEDLTEGGIKYRRMKYGDNVVEFDSSNAMRRMAVTDKRIKNFRGISVGDSYDSLMAALPELKSEERSSFPGGDVGEYSLIYGKYENGTDHGIVVYDGQDPSEVRLRAGEYTVSIFLTDGRISKIEYGK